MKIVKLVLEHLLPSTILGAIAWAITKNATLFTIAITTGWLIDADHLLDFFLARRKRGKRDLLHQSIATGSYFESNGKIIVLLHSWELVLLWVAIWWTFGKPDIAVTGSLAWFVHLAIDQKSYNLSPWAYFMTYRLINRFDIRFICKKMAGADEPHPLCANLL